MTETPSTLTNRHLDLRRAQFLLEQAVADARSDGATWQQIGDALGISKQAATKTYGERVLGTLRTRRVLARDPGFLNRPSEERCALRQQWHDEDGLDYGQA